MCQAKITLFISLLLAQTGRQNTRFTVVDLSVFETWGFISKAYVFGNTEQCL